MWAPFPWPGLHAPVRLSPGAREPAIATPSSGEGEASTGAADKGSPLACYVTFWDVPWRKLGRRRMVVLGPSTGKTSRSFKNLKIDLVRHGAGVSVDVTARDRARSDVIAQHSYAPADATSPRFANQLAGGYDTVRSPPQLLSMSGTHQAYDEMTGRAVMYACSSTPRRASSATDGTKIPAQDEAAPTGRVPELECRLRVRRDAEVLRDKTLRLDDAPSGGTVRTEGIVATIYRNLFESDFVEVRIARSGLPEGTNALAIDNYGLLDYGKQRLRNQFLGLPADTGALRGSPAGTRLSILRRALRSSIPAERSSLTISRPAVPRRRVCRWNRSVKPCASVRPGRPLRLPSSPRVLLLLGDLDLRVGVGLPRRAACRPSSRRPRRRGRREEDVPRGGDELLRGRVGDRLALRDVAAGVERERVRRLRDADGAGRERDDVGERAGADHPHDRLERDRDRERREEDPDDAQLARPGEERGQEDAGEVALRRRRG